MKTLILTASLALGIAALPAAAGAQDYPPCGPGQTDKCTQHEGGGHRMGDHMMRHHHMRHHWRHHMRHHHHHMRHHHHHHHHKKG